MDGQNLPSNSNKSKEDSQKTTNTKVIQGSVKIQKKSEISKVADAFFPESGGNVGHYILTDILVPSLKKLMEDIVTNGISALLWGDSRKSSKVNSTVGKISYRNYYDQGRISGYSRPQLSSDRDLDDIIFETRGDAEEILNTLDDTIHRYGVASIGDLYEFIGKSGRHTDYKYGWSSLRDARIVRDRRGWVIDLPKAMPIE